jgi:hypothetical protein
MITTAIAVNTDGNVIISNGATFGILLAIVFSHGIVCSAGTKILARLNLFYVFLNCELSHFDTAFHVELILQFFTSGYHSRRYYLPPRVIRWQEILYC